MNHEQMDKLLFELAATRESFDVAIERVRWNKINAMIQYLLLSAALIFGVIGFAYYRSEQHAACVSDNQMRADFRNELQQQAAAIGVSISIVSGAEEGKYEEYIKLYGDQMHSEFLMPREC